MSLRYHPTTVSITLVFLSIILDTLKPARLHYSMSSLLDKHKESPPMKPSKTLENTYHSRTLKNVLHLAGWAGAWLATCALMAFGPRFLWNQDLPFTLVAVGLNFAIGVGLVLAHKRYLASLDELQRKVYLDALGITVGVILIVSIPYAVLDRYNIVHLNNQVSGLMVLMSVTFLVSLFYGTWRYR